MESTLTHPDYGMIAEEALKACLGCKYSEPTISNVIKNYKDKF